MTKNLFVKSSSVEDKRPTPSQLQIGQLGLGYNEAGAFLCCKDSAGNIQQIGGVKISEDAPFFPVKQTPWLKPSTGAFYIYDGSQWQTIISGSGGGSGSGVAEVIGGEGLTVNPTSGRGTVTLNSDIATSKGLEFISGQVALNIGEGLEFDPTTGKVKSSPSAVSYKGEVNLTTSTAKPTGVSAGDAFYNGGTGTSNSVWNPSPATGTAVTAGDLVVYNGSGWDYIPSGAAYSNPQLWSRTVGVISPANAGDDVEIGGNKIELKSTGEAYFTSDVSLGNQAPASRLSINVLTRGIDGIDFTNSGGNNIYAGIKCEASSNDLYFENRSAGKTLYIEDNGDVKIGGSLPSSPAIHLKNAGGADFDQSINISLVDTSSTTASGVVLKASGTVRIQRTDSSVDALSIYHQDVETVSVTTGGFAEYAGSVTVNRALSNNPAFIARQAGVEKAKIRADGQAFFSGPVSIGGFDAAHTIDEYEEGIFTPAVKFGGSTTGITYNGRKGSYTRIGDQVILYVYVNMSSKGSSTGNVSISLLPFGAANVSTSGLLGWPGSIVSRQQNFSNLPANSPNIAVSAASNGTSIALRTVSGVSIDNTNFSNNSILEFQLMYITDE